MMHRIVYVFFQQVCTVFVLFYLFFWP